MEGEVREERRADVGVRRENGGEVGAVRGDEVR